ncbi:unnamed protein product, partial [Musa textilis]
KEKSRHRSALQFPSERANERDRENCKLRRPIYGPQGDDGRLRRALDGRAPLRLPQLGRGVLRPPGAHRPRQRPWPPPRPRPRRRARGLRLAPAAAPAPSLDRFLPDSATESNRNPGRPARPARTRRSATMAGEAEEPEEEEESVVTSRHRKRKPQPLLSQHKCLKDQLGSTKPDGITSHKMKAGEAGASQIAQRDTNTTLSKKRSASNRSVGAV